MPDSKPGLFDRALRAEQRGNKEIRDLWQRYQGHRQQVTAAILALAPASGGRLCLLGAGNANDLDLEQLAGRFEEVHLVDIDAAALARASGRQTPAVRARLRSHAPVDVSGLYQQLATWNVAPSPLPPVRGAGRHAAPPRCWHSCRRGSTWWPPAACSARCPGRWNSC